MPRRVQDILPNKHRSIRGIPVEREAANLIVRKEKFQQSYISKKQKKNRSKKWLYILVGIVVVVAGVGYVASVYFSYATFKIVPKTIPISVNSTYVLQNDSSKGVLAYEIVSIKDSLSTTVPATNGPKVSINAKGEITLYNAYSSSSQRLIAGTRLSDDTGRIYRLTSSVVIPGYTSLAGNNIPGTLTTSVVADQPGSSYNISSTDSVSDFKIVAYKGTPRYTSMYGRLLTDISGGFVGTQKVIDPKVLASTTKDLQDRITDLLLTQIKTSISEEYIMYPNSYVTSFEAPSISGTDPKLATVSIKGSLYGILFKKSNLIPKIAGEKVADEFEGFSYEAKGLEDLEFNIANAKDFSPEKKNTLIIKLKGDAVLAGIIPVDTIKSKLAGLSLREAETVFRTYKPIIEIDKSSGEITPPWSKVPINPERINIEVLTK